MNPISLGFRLSFKCYRLEYHENQSDFVHKKNSTPCNELVIRHAHYLTGQKMNGQDFNSLTVRAQGLIFIKMQHSKAKK